MSGGKESFIWLVTVAMVALSEKTDKLQWLPAYSLRSISDRASEDTAFQGEDPFLHVGVGMS